jgi:hypothetical protein
MIINVDIGEFYEHVGPSLFQRISDDNRPTNVNIYMHFSVLELSLPRYVSPSNYVNETHTHVQYIIVVLGFP